jgi:hypothetical protein
MRLGGGNAGLSLGLFVGCRLGARQLSLDAGERGGQRLGLLQRW